MKEDIKWDVLIITMVLTVAILLSMYGTPVQ